MLGMSEMIPGYNCVMPNQYTHRLNVIGHAYGRLIVVADAPSLDRWKRRRVRCRCACGHVGIYDLGALRAGNTRSCGCLMRERTATLTFRHGHIRAHKPSLEYTSWAAMKQRCMNPRNPAYMRY